MLRGSPTSYIDVAQVALYVFWAFFAGLILYLRREDHREGYPLVSEVPGQTEMVTTEGFPMPSPKTFRLYHGGVAYAPQAGEPRMAEGGVPAAIFPGAPLEPTGNPLLDGIGPASYCNRLDLPDLTIDGLEKFKPLRVALEYRVDPRLPHPQGMRVIAMDGIDVGGVIELWIDEVEHEVVFLEVELTGVAASPRILIPQMYVRYRPRQRQVQVRALRAADFADIPRTRDPDRITRLEEDKILGYFGGGAMYSTGNTRGPLL